MSLAKLTERAPTQRTGRLPLPARVTTLAPCDEHALEGVHAFVDRLADTPMKTWLEIGRSVVAADNDDDARATAWSVVDRTIADRGRAITAWYVRDAVETAAFLARHSTRLSSAERRVFAAAHAAAEDAALSLLARDGLTEDDFATMYAPFAPLGR